VQYTEAPRPPHSGGAPAGTFFDLSSELDASSVTRAIRLATLQLRGESRIERRTASRERDCPKHEVSAAFAIRLKVLVYRGIDRTSSQISR
jgi:hypothetical protein